MVLQLMKQNEALSGQLEAVTIELNEKSASIEKIKKLK